MGVLLERCRGEHGRPSPGDAPTPETSAKLAQDAVRHMLARGTLLAEHADAADEIRDVFEAVTAGLAPSARRLSPDAVPERSHRRYLQPVERLPEQLRRRWRQRYKPWADAMAAVTVAGAGAEAYTMLNLVIDVVVDGHSLVEIDRRLGVRKGTAAMHLRGALHRYAVIVGWLRPADDGTVAAPRKRPPRHLGEQGAAEQRPRERRATARAGA